MTFVCAIIGVPISYISSHLRFNKTVKPNYIVSTCNNYIDFNMLNLALLFQLETIILIVTVNSNWLLLIVEYIYNGLNEMKRNLFRLN